MVTQLICQYAQMVLWFSHSGLLPEGLGKVFNTLILIEASLLHNVIVLL